MQNIDTTQRQIDAVLEADRQINKNRDRQTDRYIDRQVNRQIDKQREREGEREKERRREGEIEKCSALKPPNSFRPTIGLMKTDEAGSNAFHCGPR